MRVDEAEAEALGASAPPLELLHADRGASLTSLTRRSPPGSTTQGTSPPAKQSRALCPRAVPPQGVHMGPPCPTCFTHMRSPGSLRESPPLAEVTMIHGAREGREGRRGN